MVSRDLTKATDSHTGLKREFQRLKQECLVLHIENESLRKMARSSKSEEAATVRDVVIAVREMLVSVRAI